MRRERLGDGAPISPVGITRMRTARTARATWTRQSSKTEWVSRGRRHARATRTSGETSGFPPPMRCRTGGESPMRAVSSGSSTTCATYPSKRKAVGTAFGGGPSYSAHPTRRMVAPAGTEKQRLLRRVASQPVHRELRVLTGSWVLKLRVRSGVDRLVDDYSTVRNASTTPNGGRLVWGHGVDEARHVATATPTSMRSRSDSLVGDRQRALQAVPLALFTDLMVTIPFGILLREYGRRRLRLRCWTLPFTERARVPIGVTPSDAPETPSGRSSRGMVTITFATGNGYLKRTSGGASWASPSGRATVGGRSR